MILGIPKEVLEQEGRVAAIPETVAQYKAMGFEVLVQEAAGEAALCTDESYARAGAEIVADAADLFARADLVLKVKQPWISPASGKHEAEMLREGASLVTFLHPATPGNHEMVRMLARRGVTSFTMDGVPRISRAQTMDALTSMSTITGYKSVLLAANRFPKFIPLLGTAIGTIKAAKFLIVGGGVVGLQAIATAKRLGGSVTAVDIREDARKAADSIGAKVAGFEVPADLAIDDQGRTRALPDDWLEKERAVLAPLVAEADMVILSALVPGEVAPLLVTEAMVAEMKPGSIIIDVSVDQGGNCAATRPGAEAVHRGVSIVGLWNIPGSMPVHGSWLYARNMLHFIKNLYKRGLDAPDLDDDIVRATLVTRGGEIVHAGALKAMAPA
ncbi:MAG: NAD(P) transhydrogenase subunit alpha [Planctomycetota bacterium]|nr:NAD(P) transhydrogenase subunit alpha [Planctomycetota bacterium]